MSDEPKPSQPTSPQTSSIKNAQIFTMPEAYRHGKEVKLVEPIKEQKSVLLPTTPPPPPKSSVAEAKPVAKQNHKALIIAGVIVLIALGIGGYLLLRSSQRQTPAPVVVQPPAQPVSRPAVETPVVQEEPEPSPTEIQSPFATEVVPGKDSDSDGLTDLEETSIYETNPNLPDTDADGFLDGNEVFHRYHPGGIAPGTLLDAGVVKIRKITDTLQIAYPTSWQTTESPISFVSTTGETIYITTQTSLVDWLVSQGGQEQVVKTVSKSGNEMYLTQDKRHAFLIVKDASLEFRYELFTKSTIDYLQTFQMMLNSVSGSQ